MKPRLRPRLAALAVVVAALGAGCGVGGSKLVPGSSIKRGHDLIVYYGCGACHQIGGVTNANGHVGPPLKNFRQAVPFIVGRLANTPGNVERWIQHPQQIQPNAIMPNLGVTPEQARDIAAYLYTQ